MNSSTGAFGMKERIFHAVRDPELRAKAIARWQEVAPHLLHAKDERIPAVSLRASDAGNCVRKLWNQLHGNPEIPTPDTQLSRFDIGEVYGAWLACLLAVSLESAGYETEVEGVVAYGGVQGHIDLYFYDPIPFGGTKPDRGVVEFKTTYWSGVLDAPEDRAAYQILQAGTYAAAKNVDDFWVITFGPAVANRRGQINEKMREDHYTLSEWHDDVNAEWMRLGAATDDREPNEDVDGNEMWRCRECPVRACVNNPAKEAVHV